MTRISTGTVSIANGETIFTLWDGDNDVVLSEITAPAGSAVVIEGVANFVKTRLTSASAELVLPHAGAGGAGLVSAISAMTPAETQAGTLNARLATVIQGLDLVQANGLGLFYRFSDTTSDSDPGPGYLQFNNPDPALVTEIYIDDISASNFAVGALLDAWGAGSSPVKGMLALGSATNDGRFGGYEMTGAVIDNTGYRTLPVTAIGDPSAWSAEDALMLSFAPKGNQGDSFTADAEAANEAGRAAYDAEDEGFVVLLLDDGGTPARSRFDKRVGAAGNWTSIGYLSGPQGDQGVKGDKGWIPVIVAEVDGARLVKKLSGYVGGEGDPPTENVGLYQAAGGTWTATVGDALDFRGIAGAGTVGAVISGTGTTVDATDPTQPIVNVDAFTGDAGAGGALGGVPAPAAGDAAANKFLSAGGGWLAIDLSSLEITVSLLALQVADNTNLTLFLGDTGNRVADSFDALTYVDVAGATNLDTGTAGLLKPTVTAEGAISQATGTNIGDMTGSGGLAGAYDGSANTYADRGAVAPGYVGKNYSSAPKKISKVVATSHNSAAGFDGTSAASNITITLYGKNGGAPSSGTDGTSLGTTGSFADGAGPTAKTITSSDQATLWDYVWVYITSSVAEPRIAEVVFHEPGVTNNLTVRSAAFTAAAAPTKMKALIRVKEVVAATAGTDYMLECSRDGGTTWTAMALTELFTSASPTASIRVVEAAETDVSGQPSGTSPRWRFKTLNNKMVEMHDAYLYWN